VDTATDTLVNTINLSTGGAYGIDICANANYAYVSNDSNVVAVVDLINMIEVDTFTTSGSLSEPWPPRSACTALRSEVRRRGIAGPHRGGNPCASTSVLWAARTAPQRRKRNATLPADLAGRVRATDRRELA
jgi:hypothetical protein